MLFQSAPAGTMGNPLSLLTNAMALDFAERCASERNLSVYLCGFPGEDNLGDSTRARVHRMAGDRVTAVRGIYTEDPDALVVTVFGTNPFYPLGLLQEGIALLTQDDDVIVVGESRHSGNRRKALWIGTKKHHPPIHELTEEVDIERVLALLGPQDGSLVIPMRSVRDIAFAHDLLMVQHEIERAQLLGSWHPARTASVLRNLEAFREED